MVIIRQTARTAILGAVIAAAVTAAGCSTQPLPPTQAQPVVTVTADGASLQRETAPRNTGVYPSFSDPLTAANAQMSDDEATKMQGRLASLAHARRSGAISEAEYQRRVAEMRKLAAEHGVEAQAEITN